MRHLLVFACIFPLLSCQEQDIPIGLYDYQIVRLLASDSAKTWFRSQYVTNGEIQPIDGCADSIYTSFVLHERYPEDSVYVYEIIPKSDCSASDTLLLGLMSPSGIDNIFTDSLNFKDGSVDFMLLEYITSRFLKLNYQRGGASISASFEAIQ
ncbi:MAG: hypothetical protein RIC06_10905 [Cyclobacteriaceae bacterium]